MKKVVVLLIAMFCLFKTDTAIANEWYEFHMAPMPYVEMDDDQIDIYITSNGKPIEWYGFMGKNIRITKSSKLLLFENIYGVSKQDAKTIVLICDGMNLTPNPRIAKKIGKYVKRYIIKQYSYPSKKIKIQVTDYN